MWKNKKRYLYLNYEETRVVLQSLIRLKNALIQEVMSRETVLRQYV